MIGEDHFEAELEGALGLPVAAVERRPSPYRTSFALEEVDVQLSDGGRLALIFKDLSRSSLHPVARNVKPGFLDDPLREIEVYRDVLEPAGVGAPRFYGAVAERGWLFIERVAGAELYQVGERSTWEHVARRLGRMHAVLRPAIDRAGRAIVHDRAWYRRWPERAQRFAAERGDEEAAATLEHVVAGHDRVVERLLELPVTVVHGEFYASNVLVDDPLHPDRVAPVDWEQAAIGSGLVDLAALTSGGWGGDDRGRIAAAYRETSPDRLDDRQFAAGLEAARLHLALQWLGWSEHWTAPPEHRQDWLAEAANAFGALGRVA